MPELNLPTRSSGQLGAAHPFDLGPLLPALRSAFEDMLRPVRAELEVIRATLESRRKPHYTVDEVAELTGRAPYTVRRWIAEERIKAIRIAGTGPKGRLLVPREEIDALITSGLGAHIPDAAVD